MYDNNEDKMVMYLIHNQQYIKSLIAPYTKQLNELKSLENSLFFGDIESQYYAIVRWTIVNVLVKNTNSTVEDAFVLLDSFDIKAYINS